MAMKSYWQRLRHGRVSRRRLLGAAGMGAAGLAVVAACGGEGGSAPDGTPAAGTPKRGGVANFPNPAPWGTIDPLISVGTGPYFLFPKVYNVLLDRSRRKPDFFFMDLAEEFEQPDEETYVFTIRSGVKIAPNDLGIPERDLDSVDALRWLERVGQDEAALQRSFTELWLDSSEAPDAQTFNVRTKGPYAYLLFRIGPPFGGTMPPREFFEQDISLADKGVGAGPFAIRSGTFQEEGFVVMDRNPNYYRKGPSGEPLPYVDTIEYTLIPDRQPRRTAFIDHQILSYGAQNREDMEDVRGQVPDAAVVEQPLDTFISFNMNIDVPPWNDERVRKAANFALNRQEFVDRIVGADGGKIDGLVHWPLGDFALPPEELEQLQPHDPERARQLIREATSQDTVKIKVMYPVTSVYFHDEHLAIWLQQMQAAGFEIDADPVDFGVWLDRYERKDFEAHLALNQLWETPEICLDFHHSRGPQGDEKFLIGIGKLYPEIDQAIEDSKRTTDPEDQVEKIREVQRLIYDKGPGFLPIMSWITYDLRHSLLKGFTSGLGTTGRYLASEWWLDV